MAKYYPIFLDVSGKPVVVVGAGKVALRKTRGLVEAGAQVTVVSPRFEPEFENLQVIRKRRRFRAADVSGASLVFAATDDRAVNHAVSLSARKHGVPCNVADSQTECDFIVPARITRGNLQIAISTGGSNPRLGAALRRKIEEKL